MHFLVLIIGIEMDMAGIIETRLVVVSRFLTYLITLITGVKRVPVFCVRS